MKQHEADTFRIGVSYRDAGVATKAIDIESGALVPSLCHTDAENWAAILDALIYQEPDDGTHPLAGCSAVACHERDPHGESASIDYLVLGKVDNGRVLIVDIVASLEDAIAVALTLTRKRELPF